MKQYGRSPKPRVRNGMMQGEKVSMQDARNAMEDMKGKNTNQRRHAHQKKFGC
jgi:hypothetical protein